MKCPDLDQLIEFCMRNEARIPPHVEEHLDSCPSCQGTVALLTELAIAHEQRESVPRELDEKVMETISLSHRAEYGWTRRLAPVATAGLLGALTGFLSLFMTQSMGSDGFSSVLVFCLLIGAFSAAGRWRGEAWILPAPREAGP